MQKRFIRSVVFLLLAIIAITITGCSSNNPSETSYWFSSAKTEFVAYDEEKDNLSEAGNYWYFTSAKDADIEMYLVTDAYSYVAATNLYVNDKQVNSEDVTDSVYKYAYKLSLKKGDKIKIHAFWKTSVMGIPENGFETMQIYIGQNGQTYVLTEYNKTK